MTKCHCPANSVSGAARNLPGQYKQPGTVRNEDRPYPQRTKTNSFNRKTYLGKNQKNSKKRPVGLDRQNGRCINWGDRQKSIRQIAIYRPMSVGFRSK